MKRFAALALAACLTLLSACACALGEITVDKRDLSVNAGLDRNVTNILVLLQDGERTDTVMIASINGKTGRSVMTRLDCAMQLEVRDAGVVPLGEVYALGAKGSQGLLAVRTINELLALNINTYVALDVGQLPEMVAAVGALNMVFSEAEGEAMGTWTGENELSGEAVLDYVRLRLEGDDPALSRGYDALMQLLYQGLNSGDIFGLASLGQKMLASMDTNLNPLTAMTLVTAVQGGEDRRELSLPGDAQDSRQMREAFDQEVYQ